MSSGHLYALEFANGFVKVGRSQNPYVRTRDVSKNVSRQHSTRLNRQWISRLHTDHEQTEQWLIQWAWIEGRAVIDSGRELFRDLDFERAIDYAQALIQPKPQVISSAWLKTAANTVMWRRTGQVTESWWAVNDYAWELPSEYDPGL